MKTLNASLRSWMHFMKLLNYSKTVRNQSPVQVWWQNVGSPGAKLYHRGCCYWVWQVLIRITSSCCFQREGKKFFFTSDWNESFEERGVSPLSFAFFFKAAEWLWHTPMRATHPRNLLPQTLSCHYRAMLRHQRQNWSWFRQEHLLSFFAAPSCHRSPFSLPSWKESNVW